MSLDLDLNRDVQVGRWKLGKLTPGMIDELAAWLRPVVLRQVEFVRSTLAFLGPEAASAKVDECVALLRQVDNLSLESGLAKSVMKTSAGWLKFMHLRMLTFQPTASRDDAWELVQAVAEAEAAAAAEKAAASKEDLPPNPPAPAPGP